MMTKRTLTGSRLRHDLAPGSRCRSVVETGGQDVEAQPFSIGAAGAVRLGRGANVVGAVTRGVHDLVARLTDPLEVHAVGRAPVAAPREPVLAEDPNDIAVHVGRAALAVRR